MRWLLIAALAAACAPQAADTDTDTDTEPALDYTPDPDVNTFVPQGYAPTGATRLIVLGDSISAGAGASSRALDYASLLEINDDAAWPDFTETDLETSVPSVADVIDVSQGGATTSTLIRDQLPAVEDAIGGFPAAGKTIVVFTIGGNDAQQALNPFADASEIMDATLSNMEQIVDWFLEPGRFDDGVYIYATNVYEPSDDEGQHSTCFFGFDYSSSLPVLAQYNDDLVTMAGDRGVSIVDLRGHFLGHGLNYGNTDNPHHDAGDATLWMDPDCIHPNDRGHHELRRLFHAAIEGKPLPL